MSDVVVLRRVLLEHFSAVVPKQNYGWNNSALNVLDCVLSLNRHYQSMVLPRLVRFQRDRPNVTRIKQLRKLIDAYDSPAQFMSAEFDYNDEARARVLSEVVDFTLSTMPQYEGNTELDQLSKWANSTKPSGYKTTGIRGFGIAGYQYLRMLFGCQTVKPDKHIRSYVTAIIGRPVNEIETLTLLEEAVKGTNIPLRELDAAIWERQSGGHVVYDGKAE